VVSSPAAIPKHGIQTSLATSSSKLLTVVPCAAPVSSASAARSGAAARTKTPASNAGAEAFHVVRLVLALLKPANLLMLGLKVELIHASMDSVNA
jgi:hypothetical protein